MRNALLVLTLILCGCSSASTVVEDGVEGPAVAVRVVRAEPTTDPLPSAEAAASAADVDGGSGLASPLDPTPSGGLESAEGRAHLGDLYARAGLMPEAIYEYQQSIEMEPENAVRHFKLGLAHQSMRNFEDALVSYREAARLEPSSAWAHAAVSIVLAKMGEPEQAFEAYQTVKRLDDEMAEGLLEVITQYGSFHEV